MRLQLLGQEMFCEAYCFFPDDGRWHKCSRGPSASLPQPHPWGPAIANSAFAAPTVHFAPKKKADIGQRIEHVCFVPKADICNSC